MFPAFAFSRRLRRVFSWLAALALLMAAPILFAQPAAAQFATSTSIDSSLNPSIYSQEVTFTATVSSANGTPTGTVTFFNGATPLPGGTVTLSGGQATFSISNLIPNLFAGPNANRITAAYNGDSNFQTSASSELAQVVNYVSGNTFTQLIVADINPSVP